MPGRPAEVFEHVLRERMMLNADAVRNPKSVGGPAQSPECQRMTLLQQISSRFIRGAGLQPMGFGLLLLPLLRRDTGAFAPEHPDRRNEVNRYQGTSVAVKVIFGVI